MDSPKYLVVITLVEGQNFTLPDCVIDKTAQATVFAEARFDNEPLRSDPVKLVNTNPEFLTELAWQLDRRSLHQFRVERRAIKLQIFMQTTPFHSKGKDNEDSVSSSTSSPTRLETNQIQLVGYTIIDIRAAQERDQQKFDWRPLLNPKFRKASYNRPEIQLAVSLIKCKDNEQETSSSVLRNAPYTSRFQKSDVNSSLVKNCDIPDEHPNYKDDGSIFNDSTNSQLYKTCLDYTLACDENGQTGTSHIAIIENDINIKVLNGNIHYIYDAQQENYTIEDCKTFFSIEVSIAFISDLETILLGHTKDYLESTSNSAKYYFTFSLFGSSIISEDFTLKECNLKPKIVKFQIATTSASLLSTYFILNSALDIKLYNEDKKILGYATVQLDQLCCDIDTDLRSRRSIEGMFALQACDDSQIQDSSVESYSPTVGVAVALTKLETLDTVDDSRQKAVLKSPTAKHFGQLHSPSKIVKNSTIIETHLFDTNDQQIEDKLTEARMEVGLNTSEKESLKNSMVAEDLLKSFESDVYDEDQTRHFCFTIDLKTLTTLDDVKIELSNLLIRYSYSFFGYTDTITTNSSVPIGPHEALIPHGFCEFNFATTLRSLKYAFDNVPLILELVLNTKNGHLNGKEEELEYEDGDLASAGFGHIRLANLFDVDRLKVNGDSCLMTSAIILGCDKTELGNLQLYLSLKDLGPTKIGDQNINSDLSEATSNKDKPSCSLLNGRVNFVTNTDKLLVDASNEIASWKDQQLLSFKHELQQKEQEYLTNITHKLEAKETKRDAELKKKMTDLNKLERKLRNALLAIESKERHLDQKEQQLNNKDRELSSRLANIDLEVAKAIEEVKLSYQQSSAECQIKRAYNSTESHHSSQKQVSHGISQPIRVARRSSLRDQTAASSRSPGIPLPIRSSSLVRGTIEGLPLKLPLQRFGRNGNNHTTTTNNNNNNTLGSSSRITSKDSGSRSSLVRPGSFKSMVTKDTQQKLVCLRKERTDLLKKGCRPNDNLIIEINNLIEKLARQ